MSLTMVRMNTASSQTNTVLPTLPPLSEDVVYQCLDVEHVHPLPVNLNDANGNPFADFLEPIDWNIVDVPNVVDKDSGHAIVVLNEQNQPTRSRAGRLSQCYTAIDNGDDRAAEIDQATDGVGRARKPRGSLRRHNLAKQLHVTREGATTDFEHQQSTRWYPRLFFSDMLGRIRYNFTHRS
jgi:hypothetical protein